MFRRALPALGVWMAVAVFTKYPDEYWGEKARVALRDRRYPDAISFASRAIQHGSQNFELYFHLGEAERSLALGLRNPERKQHLESAVNAFRSSLQIFPYDEHTLVRLAQTLGELGRLAEARLEYQKAIAHDPNLGVLHGYYSKHLFRVGREEEGREALNRAKQLGAHNLQNIIDPAFADAPMDPALPPVPPQ